MKIRLEFILQFRDSQDKLENLTSLPKSIDEAYAKLLNRLEGDDKRLAFKILSWIYYALRPLLMEELREALSVRLGQTRLNSQALLARGDIIECCQGLVVLEKSSDTVRFTHQTVKNFLQKEHVKDLLSANDIANFCLTYLSFDNFNMSDDRQEREKRAQMYHFIRYATSFWGIHCRGDPENSADIQLAILSLFAPETKRSSFLKMESYLQFPDATLEIDCYSHQTLLHIIARVGLAKMCEVVLDYITDASDMYVSTPDRY